MSLLPGKKPRGPALLDLRLSQICAPRSSQGEARHLCPGSWWPMVSPPPCTLPAASQGHWASSSLCVPEGQDSPGCCGTIRMQPGGTGQPAYPMASVAGYCAMCPLVTPGGHEFPCSAEQSQVWVSSSLTFLGPSGLQSFSPPE